MRHQCNFICWQEIWWGKGEAPPQPGSCFHVSVSGTKLQLGCQNSPRSCSNSHTTPVSKDKSAGVGIFSSPSSHSSCQLWFPCGALPTPALLEGLMSPPALSWCCLAKYKTQLSAPKWLSWRMIWVLKMWEFSLFVSQRFTGRTAQEKLLPSKSFN